MANNGTEMKKAKPSKVNTISTRLKKSFVERNEILSKLENLCGEEGCRTALVGIGGIG